MKQTKILPWVPEPQNLLSLGSGTQDSQHLRGSGWSLGQTLYCVVAVVLNIQSEEKKNNFFLLRTVYSIELQQHNIMFGLTKTEM